MIAKHTMEQILPADKFALLCMVTLLHSRSDQHRIASCEMILNGWNLLHLRIREMIAVHCTNNKRDATGRAAHLYECITERHVSEVV